MNHSQCTHDEGLQVREKAIPPARFCPPSSDLLIPSRISRVWPRRRLFHFDVTRNLFLLLLRFWDLNKIQVKIDLETAATRALCSRRLRVGASRSSE